MNKFILRLSLLGLLAAAVAGAPAALHAQNTTNAPATTKKPAHRVLPFHGKLKAIDNTNKTISIGNETIQITSETKITKAGKPATFEDAVVGEEVAGASRKDADGKLIAVSLRFAPRPVAESNTKTNAP
jgi:hypothetical protein